MQNALLKAQLYFSQGACDLQWCLLDGLDQSSFVKASLPCTATPPVPGPYMLGARAPTWLRPDLGPGKAQFSRRNRFNRYSGQSDQCTDASPLRCCGNKSQLGKASWRR